MELFLNQISDELIYKSHTINNDTLTINCFLKKKENMHVKTYYYREIKDINYGSYKVILNIRCIMYYVDRKKGSSAFAHKLDFVEPRCYRTKRLSNYITENMKESSAIGFERTIRKNVANISDSTILRHIKKKICFE